MANRLQYVFIMVYYFQSKFGYISVYSLFPKLELVMFSFQFRLC